MYVLVATGKKLWVQLYLEVSALRKHFSGFNVHILHGSLLWSCPWRGGVGAETLYFWQGLANHTFSRKGVSHTKVRFKEGVGKEIFLHSFC